MNRWNKQQNIFEKGFEFSFLAIAFISPFVSFTQFLVHTDAKEDGDAMWRFMYLIGENVGKGPIVRLYESSKRNSNNKNNNNSNSKNNSYKEEEKELEEWKKLEKDWEK